MKYHDDIINPFYACPSGHFFILLKEKNMKIIKNTKEKCPLVHCITNYVTVNDVANIILACGGSPIMADEINEVKDMQTICNALVINIGTLNERTLNAMIEAGKTANALNHPVVLDPVGCGATPYRTKVIKTLLDEIHFDVIKGNISEIKALIFNSNKTKGVDASSLDLVTDDNLDETIAFTKKLSKITKSIIAITGPIDVICDENKAYYCLNGTKAMGKITGTGCMTAGVVASYLAANPENKLEAVAKSIAAVGLCGEISEKNAVGTGSLHIGLIDAMSNLDDDMLNEGQQLYER